MKYLILRVPILIVCIFIISSCKVDLNKKDIYWLTYEINDTLIYENSKDFQTDSFLICWKYNSNTGWKPFEIDMPSTGIYSPAEAGIRIRSRHFCKSLNTQFCEKDFITLRKSKPGSKTTVEINFLDFFTAFKPDTIRNFNKTINIDNRIYTEVICLKPKFKHNNEESLIKCIYWNKEYGLIRYDRNNGEIWTRSNIRE